MRRKYARKRAELAHPNVAAEAARRAAELAEAQYRSIFEATSDGLVINDMDGYRVEVNPAFCEMHGFTREELIGTHSRVLIHHPDSLGLVEEYMAAVTQGRTFRTQAMDLRKDGTPLYVEVHGGPFTYRGTPHVLDVVRDITERVEAYQLLERRVEERTRELATLLESFAAIAEALTSGGDLETVLQCIAAQALRLLHATSARVRIPDASGTQLILAAVADDDAAGIRMPPPDFTTPVATDPIAGEPFRTGRPRVARGAPRRGIPGAQHALYCSVPLIIRGRANGVLIIWRTTDAPFSDDDAVIARIFGNAAALAIEEMRLLTEERERTRELATLLEVSRNVASTLDLQPLLGLILDQLKTVVDYTSAMMVTIEGNEFEQVEYRGPLPRERVVGIRLGNVEKARQGILWQMYRTLRPIIIPDVWADTALTRAYRAVIGEERFPTVDRVNHSWMGVPLVVNEREIGLLAINHTEPDHFTARDAELAMAIATHAAIAIENARLYEASNAYAALQERARLARELHDSVTQVLFSMTLHARAMLKQLERAGSDPDGAVHRNVRLLSELAQGALAEMRMLIFELRPGALTDEGLVGAIRKLAAALGAREGIAIEVDAPAARIPLAAAAEEQLYRLTQEALNNVVKHAKARRMTIRLRVAAEEGNALLLTIADDGAGFDTGAAHPGHMGLGTMAERAQAIGGACTIASAPGEGTTVRVVVPAALPVA